MGEGCFVLSEEYPPQKGMCCKLNMATCCSENISECGLAIENNELDF